MKCVYRMRVVGECHIKGNINPKGERNYHIPGGEWYGPTKIDRSKGAG